MLAVPRTRTWTKGTCRALCVVARNCPNCRFHWRRLPRRNSRGVRSLKVRDVALSYRDFRTRRRQFATGLPARAIKKPRPSPVKNSAAASLNPTSRRLRRWSRCEKNEGQVVLGTAGLRTLIHAFWVGTSDGIQGERLGSIKSRLVAHYIGMHGPAGTAEIFYFCRRPAKIHCNPVLSFYPAK